MNESHDHPWDEVLRNAEQKIAAGWTVYQKFSCSRCGQRLTMEVPNTFYPSGNCDKCGTLTDIKVAGCNFMAVK